MGGKAGRHSKSTRAARFSNAIVASEGNGTPHKISTNANGRCSISGDVVYVPSSVRMLTGRPAVWPLHVSHHPLAYHLHACHHRHQVLVRPTRS